MAPVRGVLPLGQTKCFDGGKHAIVLSLLIASSFLPLAHTFEACGSASDADFRTELANLLEIETVYSCNSEEHFLSPEEQIAVAKVLNMVTDIPETSEIQEQDFFEKTVRSIEQKLVSILPARAKLFLRSKYLGVHPSRSRALSELLTNKVLAAVNEDVDALHLDEAEEAHVIRSVVTLIVKSMKQGSTITDVVLPGTLSSTTIPSSEVTRYVGLRGEEYYGALVVVAGILIIVLGSAGVWYLYYFRGNRLYGLTRRRKNSMVFTTGPDGADKFRVGHVVIHTDNILGQGGDGNVIFKGWLGGRDVAVKRTLQTRHDYALREITAFVQSDGHPNVLRYYAKEEDENFIYIALELCAQSVHDYVTAMAMATDGSEVAYRLNMQKHLMYEIAVGLQHLHTHKLVHRDLTPRNILINHRGQIKIADLSMAHIVGSGNEPDLSTDTETIAPGWRAPEVLKCESVSYKSDIFSLGMLYYFMGTGVNPFGVGAEVEYNIIHNNRDIKLSIDTPDFEHLITWLLATNEEDRPSAFEVLHHPFFWTAEKSLQFLSDVSDRLESASDTSVGSFDKYMWSAGIPRDWSSVDIHPALMKSKYRKYDTGSPRDFLRALRNKRHHYNDISEEDRYEIGEMPDGFLNHFLTRVPCLLISVFSYAKEHYRSSEVLNIYFPQSALARSAHRMTVSGGSPLRDASVLAQLRSMGTMDKTLHRVHSASELDLGGIGEGKPRRRAMTTSSSSRTGRKGSSDDIYVIYKSHNVAKEELCDTNDLVCEMPGL